MRRYMDDLDALGVPLFRLSHGDDIKGKWDAPPGWTKFTAGQNARNLAKGDSDAYGMLCGGHRSVLDIDPRNGGTVEDLVMHGLVPPLHAVIQTGGGGWHLVVDALGFGGKLPPGIDVLDAGRFAFIPPTPGYRVLPQDEWPTGLLAAQDAGAVERLRNQLSAAAASPTETSEPYDGHDLSPVEAGILEGALAKYAAKVSSVPEGTRNDTLNKQAYDAGRLVAGAGLDEDRAREVLAGAAVEAGLEEGEIAYTIESGMKAGLRNPRALIIDDVAGPAPVPSTITERLRALADERYDFICDAGAVVYAVRKGGHLCVLAGESANSPLGQELSAAYYDRFRKVPSGQPIIDTLRGLQQVGKQSDPVRVYRRTARLGDTVYVDVGDKAGRVVRITPDGWDYVEESPVLFRRSGLTAPMGEPLPPGAGKLDDLWELANVAPEDRPLLAAWLVHALIDSEGAHTALTFTGEQGTGKSMAVGLCVDLVDPSHAKQQALSDDPRDLHALLSNTWVVSLDNLSGMRAKTSDTLSRAVTGAAQTTRRLYTDNDLHVVKLHNVLILAGITLGKLNADFEERMLPIEMHRLPTYMEEERWKARWDEAYPSVMGALLDLAVKALQAETLGLVPTPEGGWPRMSSYAKVLCSVDAALSTNGWQRYRENEARMATDSASGSPLITWLMDYCRKRKGIALPAKHIFKAMASSFYAPPPEERRGFPETSLKLANELKRGLPTLRKMGWTAEETEDRHDKVKVYRVLPPEHEGPVGTTTEEQAIGYALPTEEAGEA